MSISRRSVLTGIGAAALAPALPSVTAEPRVMLYLGTEIIEHATPLYGRSPLMIDGLPTMRALQAAIRKRQ